MEVSQFKEKLNKVEGNVYVIEEAVQIVNGMYEAELIHDNVNESTLSVYTGPKLTGNRIQSFAISTPSMTPWKRVIRVYADVPRVYISYETDGDTVEAEDVNRLQESAILTQKALNDEVIRAETVEASLTNDILNETVRAESAERVLTDNLAAETSRAEAAEKKLTDDLFAEITRATGAEATLTDNLSAEISRATGAEAVLTDNLATETTRATGAEKTLTSNLNAEMTRAKAAEKANADNIITESNRATDKEAELQGSIQTETTRAQAAEKTLMDHLSAEVTRSKGAEKTLTDNLAAEVTRAKTAEKTNSDSVSAEVTRAKAKEVELQGNITAEVSRATAAENDIRSTISTNKPNWDDKYTRNEVDNKFSALETAIDWKEAVATFADLATTYPKPDDGWTVNVKDTDYTYRWSGTAWIAISANAIPKATQSVDGLLSKEDKAALDDTNAKKHTHSNKSTLDKLTETLLTNWTDAYNKRHEHGNKTVIDRITQTLLDNWTAAYTHISDAVKHITATERTNWNDADSKKHTHTNKAVIDKITQILLDNWSAAYTHISDAVKHITADERTTWNTVSNKVDKVSGKQLSTNDYTAAEKNKLSGIAPGAEVNVQSDWNVADENSDAYIRNKPTTMPASDVLAWAKAANKPAYSWTEITSKPSTFPPSSHNHTKNQITDMPTKVSQFTNDAGYITQADVDTSQSHTHSNKTILDKITQAMLDKWNSALTALPVHTHTKSQITDFPASLPANGGTANYANYLNVNNIAANTDLNTITTPGYYYCPMSATVTTFKNSPTTMAFFMEVGKHAGVYQRIVEYTVSNPKTYERNYYSNAWGTWKNITVLTPVPAGAKFTDTVYTHPNSGVVAGEYQSVTVNAQGHVTGGVPKGAFTWAQLKGAYTWGDLKGGS
ncbi:pyocin knob domain-containing protein [Hungatella hathewayi]|uniref:pyocin knob domain-containing protein n=1 Tax=Hungatella hathewayi TaxID=154046 RepID=UPI0035667FA6